VSGLRKTLRVALGATTFAWCAAGAPAPWNADDTHAAQAAGSPYLEVVDPAEAMRSPAYRYANMTNEEAFAELDRRHILYTKQGPTLGVRAPIRLTGRLHGVHVHSSLPPEQRPSTPFEILDARLALALDDFCAILARHDVDELVHYTMYRPNVQPPGYIAQLASPAESSKGDAETTPAKRSGTATSQATDGKAPASTRSAKKKPGAKTSLDKGERAPKGTAATSTRRTGRKDAYGVELEGDLDLEPSLDDVLHDKAESRDDTASDDDDAIEELAKGAPKAGKPAASNRPVPGARPGSTGKASGTSPAPRPTAIVSTSRRTAAAIRRPPAMGDEGEATHTHGKWAPPGTRHPAGLAIDLGAVRKRDGRWLSIASHFGGKIGQRTCGAGAAIPEAADAKELHAMVCEARDAGVFTYALTPNYNQDHVDHVHFEIKPGVTWFLFH